MSKKSTRSIRQADFQPDKLHLLFLFGNNPFLLYKYRRADNGKVNVDIHYACRYGIIQIAIQSAIGILSIRFFILRYLCFVWIGSVKSNNGYVVLTVGKIGILEEHICILKCQSNILFGMVYGVIRHTKSCALTVIYHTHIGSRLKHHF